MGDMFAVGGCDCNCGGSCTLAMFPLCMAITDFNISGSPVIHVNRPNSSSNWTGTYSYSYPACAMEGCSAATVVLTYQIYLNSFVYGGVGALEVSYGVNSSGCPTSTIPPFLTFETGSFTAITWGCTPTYNFQWLAIEADATHVGINYDHGDARTLYCVVCPFTWSAVPCP